MGCWSGAIKFFSSLNCKIKLKSSCCAVDLETEQKGKLTPKNSKTNIVAPNIEIDK